VYNIIASGEKENLTVLLNINAAGDLAPPLVVFSMKRMSKLVAERAPKDWCLGKSDNGWMTRELFYEYMVNTFHPWLTEKEIPRPVIVFFDGHVSHLTYHLSQFCKDNQIELVILYPNATHLIQPLDVGIFKPLKSEWKKVVLGFKAEKDSPEPENSAKVRRLKKENFCEELQKAIQRSVTPGKIKNAFRASGLFPFDADNVKYKNLTSQPASKEIPENIDTKNSKNSCPPSGALLEHLEKYLGEEKLEEFRKNKHRSWLGDEKNESLFKFWKHLEDSDSSLNLSSSVSFNEEVQVVNDVEPVNMNDG